MKKKNLSARFIGKFSSIQSVIFATVAVLILSAVVIVTGVSMKFTNTSIFENSSEYTHTIIQQMNQNRFLYRLYGKYCLSDIQQ